MAVDSLTIPSPFDAHVHLRQGDLMKLVVPHVKQGGINLAYVMPNLIPPITTPDMAASYLTQLRTLSPSTEFLTTLYLSSSLTPEMIREAHASGVVGVKSYPRGVTTNSEGGVGMEGYGVYDQVFAEMEKVDMVLNLHGEVPSDVDGDGTCVLDAEPRFIPHLIEINRKFPKLRIVLEHCTTSAAVEAVRLFTTFTKFIVLTPSSRSTSQKVKSLPSTVVATITPHHLLLTIDSAVSTSLNYCKPLAKYPSDRAALRSVIREGNPKFFLGSDSAPHPTKAKLPSFTLPESLLSSVAKGKKATTEEVEEISLPSPCAAGIYTSPDLLPLLATTFEICDIPLERLEGFASTYGRMFYGYEAKAGEEVRLKRVEGGGKVRKAWEFGEGEQREWVIPFMAGQNLGWEIEL